MTETPATPVTMTLQDFLDLSEREENGNRFELNEGELISLSPTGVPHGWRVTKISSYLDRLLPSSIYAVLSGETGIIMAIDPKPTVRGMDVAVLYCKDMPSAGMLRSAPLLIVEVISPGNDALDLEKKRKQYQAFGVQEIWFVYDDTKAVYIYTADQTKVHICEWPNTFTSNSLNVSIETRELFR